MLSPFFIAGRPNAAVRLSLSAEPGKPAGGGKEPEAETGTEGRVRPGFPPPEVTCLPGPDNYFALTADLP